MNTAEKRALAADCGEGPAGKTPDGTKVSDEIRAECSLRKQVPSDLQLTAEQVQRPKADSIEARTAGKPCKIQTRTVYR